LSEHAVGPETLRVVIEQHGSEMSGRVVLITPAGSVERAVADASCADVVAALALSVALLLDREAAAEARPSAPLQAAPAPAASPPPTHPRPRRDEPPPGSGWSATVGAGVEWVDAVAPASWFGFQPFVDVTRGSDSWFALSLRGSFRYLESGVVGESDRTRFLWAAGRFELCPAQGPPQSKVKVMPCAGVGAGVLVGAAVDGPGSQREARGWFDVSATGRAVARLGIFAFDVQGGRLFPVIRYDYVFLEPHRVVHRVEAIAPMVAAGVGVSFL
jgi:hypothetical protein